MIFFLQIVLTYKILSNKNLKKSEKIPIILSRMMLTPKKVNSMWLSINDCTSIHDKWAGNTSIWPSEVWSTYPDDDDVHVKYNETSAEPIQKKSLNDFGWSFLWMSRRCRASQSLSTLKCETTVTKQSKYYLKLIYFTKKIKE